MKQPRTENRHFAADGTQCFFFNYKHLNGQTVAIGYAIDDLKWAKELIIVKTISYKTHNPSLHKCSAKCQNATGPSCECECGGRNHGGVRR